MTFSAKGLPQGLTLDAATGQITGVLRQMGEYPITLKASNKLGSDSEPLRIIVGDRIALTPAMGWSSWNCFGEKIDQQKILAQAQAMVSIGLSRHGYQYINLDDGWQGRRTGPDHALMSNEKFPDMAALIREIHGMGLKVGLYSTPWETSYAGFAGGSADNEQGEWHKLGHVSAKYDFSEADLRLWAGWGMDYLKYDWSLDLPHIEKMSRAIRSSGRDIVYSLSNSGRLNEGAEYAKFSESWRTTGDIYDRWEHGEAAWHYSVSEIGFSQDPWAQFAGPGHWNDPDMLALGYLGWGDHLHPTRLTADEQYSHFSLWAMLSAPLIFGGDLTRLDDFTLALLTNDEVIAIDQDSLGEQAVRVGADGAVDFFRKRLADGSFALGVFNRGNVESVVPMLKLERMGFPTKVKARDLWRQQDIVDFDPKKSTVTVPAHGVVLLKLTPLH